MDSFAAFVTAVRVRVSVVVIIIVVVTVSALTPVVLLIFVASDVGDDA